jgi:hypothetical protein
MPGGYERFKQNTTGCHTSALGELFIADECRSVQQKVCVGVRFTNLVRAKHAWGDEMSGVAREE